MIIDFSIKNFGPIKDEVTLSFEASKDNKLNDYYVVEPIKGVRLLKMILIYGSNSKTSQLVATTYFRELLMNKDMLRNDVIWFTEKKEDGSTDLFSLADFDSSVIRNTSSVYNAYKIGKLGAVPNLGDYYINLEDDEKDN
jgi:AAA15 family ATPase/GTPase